MIMRTVLFVYFLFVIGIGGIHPTTAWAQSSDAVVIENRSFPLSEVLLMGVVSTNNLTFKYCTFLRDSNLTDPTRETEWREKLLKISGNANGQIQISVQMQFDSCTFSSMRFKKFAFKQRLAFSNCAIDEYLGFQQCMLDQIGISQTAIATAVPVEGLVNLSLDRCNIGSLVLASNTINAIGIESSTLTQFLSVYAPFNNPIPSLAIQESIFDSTSQVQISGFIRTLEFTEDTVRGAFSFTTTILNKLALEHCAFTGAVMYESFNSPERATTLRWTQFSGFRLTVADTVNGANVVNQEDYEALLKTYSYFYNVYSKNWQDESQDACYVEMKDMQTRWYKLQHDLHPSPKRWLEWQLNGFLKTFCEYGTEPVKSLIYSMYVLFFFASIYFFFPSQPDELGKFRFTHALYNSDIHREDHDKILENLYHSRKSLMESYQKSPPILTILGRPLYLGHLLYYRLQVWILSERDYLQSLHERLEAAALGSRAMLLLVGGLYFLGLLFVTLFTRFLNAIALSLNAFVTLGYGEIQARGISRYLAVAEGAIGWFLLSIFSVSLISQILQ
jgi:hypothetical protein